MQRLIDALTLKVGDSLRSKIDEMSASLAAQGRDRERGLLREEMDPA